MTASRTFLVLGWRSAVVGAAGCAGVKEAAASTGAAGARSGSGGRAGSIGDRRRRRDRRQSRAVRRACAPTFRRILSSTSACRTTWPACSAYRRAAPDPASPSPRTARCSRTTGCGRACASRVRRELLEDHLPRRQAGERSRRLHDRRVVGDAQGHLDEARSPRRRARHHRDGADADGRRDGGEVPGRARRSRRQHGVLGGEPRRCGQDRCREHGAAAPSSTIRC